jgi:septal ring factor EnvC (AmiA/AmiB activator)
MDDEHQQAGQGTASQGEQERTYTRTEVEQRLRGQGAEIERLRAIEAEHAALLAKQAEADKAAAAARGEYEQLYSAEVERARALEAEAAAARAKIEAYEASVAAEIKAAVDGISDEERRTQLVKLLDGRPIEDQRSILAVVLASAPKAPVVPGGPPGRPKPQGVDPARFRREPAYRAAIALDEWRRGT